MRKVLSLVIIAIIVPAILFWCISSSASYVYTPREELLEESSLVVRGVVTRVSDLFTIEGTGGGQDTFKDYTIRVRETLRGEAKTKKIIVRENHWEPTGGLFVGYRSTENIVLNKGKEYVLFLVVPGGGAYCTPGNYYYIYGHQGVFSRKSIFSWDKTFMQLEGWGEEEIVMSKFRKEIKEVNSRVAPRDVEYFKERDRKTWEHNTGPDGILDMSQEEIEKELNREWYPGKIVEK